MAEIDVTRIAGNIGAMNALNSLNYINKQLAVHQTRLATGKRINSAADDPAGLTIATKMQSRSEGLKTALANIADAKNLLAVAESGMGRINDILVQMRNKVQAGGSDTMGAEERQAISDQVTAYLAQIDDLVSQTKWNGTALIGGSSDLVFQTGADSGDSVTMTAIANLNSTGLSLSASSLDTSSSASFRTFMAAIETAMSKVNAELAKVGALTGRLSFKEDQVAAAQINVEAAYNRIMNANMAEEQVNASKYQILQQTATAMLAQANAAPQFLLSLFR
ncbi:flagellin [Anaerolinea thermolimosa]|uniref:flagellin n=1 Tax=Anaerolinea thermolimosa TaxID=229919 RepID=UPI00078620A4|nr:flagellin [Anaerolinea thermolimosa]GAP07880.1 flagellin [Anaerolinea thermolimosa]